MSGDFDALVIGSGPNGLSAAIRLARERLSVLVLEGRDTIGGGTRTEELTLPGFQHDVCSAIHPLGLASPFLRSLPLAEHGLEWVHPERPLAHPLDGARAVTIERSLGETASRLGPDGRTYRKLMQPFVEQWAGLMDDLLGPLPLPPRSPFLTARFGLSAIRSAVGLTRSSFHTEAAWAVFAGMAAHSILPLERPVTAAFGLMLGTLAHAVGWPLARGGSASITDAMASYLGELGGEIRTGEMVSSLEDIPSSRILLFDTSPDQVLEIAGGQLDPGYARRLANYRYGPGVCKVDWALHEPIPWLAPEVAGAGTVHLGGTLEEIALAERCVWRGEHPERPFVLLVQQSQFDPSRAPQGKHTAWAYCHVPNGSTVNVSDRIEAQIDRFAPGFRDCIAARHVLTAHEMERYNPNYLGGDINVGVQDLGQLFTRPAVQFDPYFIPSREGPFKDRLYLCSSATPPGGGVHGMCGYHAAESALSRTFG